MENPARVVTNPGISYNRVLLKELLATALKSSEMAHVADALVYLLDSLWPDMVKAGPLATLPLHDLMLKQGLSEEDAVSVDCFIKLCEPLLGGVPVVLPDHVQLGIPISDYENKARRLGMLPVDAHAQVQARKKVRMSQQTAIIARNTAERKKPRRPLPRSARVGAAVFCAAVGLASLGPLVGTLVPKPPAAYPTANLPNAPFVIKGAAWSKTTIMVTVDRATWNRQTVEGRKDFMVRTLKGAPSATSVTVLSPDNVVLGGALGPKMENAWLADVSVKRNKKGEAAPD